MTPYMRVFLIMACFGTFHSITAREHVKTAIVGRIGVSRAWYAIIRSGTSLTLLILSLVVLFRYAGETRQIFTPYYGFRALIPTFLAFWVAGKAIQQVIKDRRLPQIFELKEYPKVFFFGGAYKMCRHPMYAGWLIASWGILLSKPYMLTVFYNLLLTVYVVFESLQEEKRMIALFGDKYLEYREKVPFLIPYGFLKIQDLKDSPQEKK